MELRRIGAISLAKIMGSIYALLGLIVGTIFSLIAVLAGSIAQPDSAVSAFTGIFGIAAVIVLPVFYGTVGFLTSLVMAGLYNWLAGIVGGVRFEFRPVAEKPGAMPL